MTIATKDTNVIILFGDGAVSHFSELVNIWSRMIAASQWDTFQFILAGTKRPELKLEEQAQKVVGNRNTVFFRIAGKESAEGDSPVPSTASFYNIIIDKVKTGTVRLHVVYDSGGEMHSTAWLQELIGNALSIGALTTGCMYYLLFGRNSYAAEEDQLKELMKAHPGAAFLLGDTNEFGGRVTPEDRLQAAALAILMNAAALKPIAQEAYSLGYSALNANGSELRHLNETAACRAISEEIRKTVSSLAAEPEMELLPEGAATVSDLYGSLQRYVQENMPQPAAMVLKNAWVTIRMGEDLSSSDAVRRMTRFADLNYAGDSETRASAREYAWQTEQKLMHTLRENVATASFSDSVFIQIADALHRIASENVQPAGCTYPKKPFRLPFGKGGQDEKYLQECKAMVLKSIREYIIRKNVSCYAEELEKVYRRIAEWIRTVRGEDDSERYRITAQELLQDIQRELESEDSGNALKLAEKYKHYAAELASLRPRLSVLTEGSRGVYFDENGTLNEESWRELVRTAGRNMVKQMNPEFRGDFFKVLKAEFSTPEERARFFDEYLKSGPRMFRHLQAVPSSGMELLLADNRLTDKWFMSRELFEVKTDNAENLTVYPLGGKTAEWYLDMDETVYFQNRETGEGGDNGGKSSGISLFGERPEASGQHSGESVFGRNESETEPQQADRMDQIRQQVRLEPDEKNMYRLYWEWNGNDENAMVELFQYGERIGRIAVIPVRRFQDNGGNMNVTDDIMGGKPLPAGTITVTVRDARHNVIIDSAEVMGRRDVIKYKIKNNKLQLLPDKSGIIEKVVLRTTETDGTHHYYPLYPSREEKTWLFEGLSVSDGRIVEDPTSPGGTVFPVRVD